MTISNEDTPVAPKGWQLVPVYPTIKMVQAATHSSVGFGTRAAYQAMLAAAPKLGGEMRDLGETLVTQHKQDNSWHERGELPPVGVPVELWWGGSFAYNCEFITRRGHHYVMWNLDADRPDAADYMNSEFRPLRTEREKAIDEMILAIDHIKEGNFETFIGALYDAGYRRVANK